LALLQTYLLLGVQSFGGGPALLYLMRRTLVEQRGWISDEEFTRIFAICQITPGINLLALPILVGWQLAGLTGAVLSLAGLLLPSVTITIALTALYTSVQQLAIVQAALQGIIPATAGLTLLVAILMARPFLVASWCEGRVSFASGCLILLGSSVVFGVGGVDTIAVLLLAGVVGALLHQWRAVVAPAEEQIP
jgi:chromate transporter